MNSFFREKEEICEIGRRMYNHGYVVATDGNISVRIDENRILITPSGVSKGLMTPYDVITIDFEGRILEGKTKPSSEAKLHLAIYKNRNDIKSVCHAHPPYATAFAVCGQSLDKPILQEVVLMLGSVPLVPYATTGTEEIAENLLPYIKNFDAYLLSNHGVLSAGINLIDSYNKMEIVEHYAKIIYFAQGIGQTRELTKDEVDKLVNRRHIYGIRPEIGIL